MTRTSNRKLWTAKVLNKPTKSGRTRSVERSRRTPFNGVVLGIDPSLRSTGLALVKFQSSMPTDLYLSQTIIIKPNVLFSECLAEISRSVTTILKSRIDEKIDVALEQTIYVQNFKTAQILGAARGASIAAAALFGAKIFEYEPLRIKKALVGVGNASKEQVARTVMQLLKHKTLLPFDESDAVAIACCHAMTVHSDTEHFMQNQ